MKRMKRQSVWRSRAYVLSVLVFAVSFIASLASTASVIAEAAKFKIKAAEITTMSAGATGAITGFDDSTIASEVSFYKLNDSATFKVTLENTDSVDHVIKGISDNNSNENISYSYDNHANETITAGSAFDFVFTAKYIKSVTDMSKRAQSLSVEFAIQFTDITEPETISVAPNTHDGITGSVIILSISSLGLIVCAVIFIKNHKQSTKALGVAATVIAAAVLATSVSAIATEVNSFTLTTNYGLYDKVVVSYGDNDYIIDYGKTLEEADEIEIPSVTGQSFGGWQDEDGNDIDPTTPITEDITIFAKTNVNHYSIAFDKNESAATGEMNSLDATYGTPVTLTDNAFSWTGHTFAGWATTPTGDVAYADGVEVNNLTAENNGTVTLYAKWEIETFVLNLDGNGRKFSNGAGVNTVKLTGTCGEPYTRARKKYSHTPNIDDYGVRDGDYPTYLETIDVISFPGAARLHATIQYSTQEYKDRLFVFKGVYDGPVTQYIFNGPQIAEYNGTSGGIKTAELDIQGDTASFAFYSDYMTGNYGYYAVIEAYDANGNLIGLPVANCDREVYSGEYENLPSGNYFFKGWSENKNDERGIYWDMADIDAHLIGGVGQTKTLYAIYDQLYTVKYDGNGSTTGTMETFARGGLKKGDFYYLNAPNYLRDGYGFIGWSMDKNAQPGGSSTIYGPNEMIRLNQDIISKAVNDGDLIMYAIWTPKNTTYTLQSFNSATFELTNPNTTITALTDTRDGKTYAVAKLADGRWWMIENLRLDPAGIELNNENTNNPNVSFANTVKNLAVSSMPTACSDDYSASCINRYAIVTTDIDPTNTPSPTENGGQTYGYGVHYNWYTATAGNGTYSVERGAAAAGDLCPSGWRLPDTVVDDATKSDFAKLDLALGGNGALQYHSNDNEKETSFPNNFVYSGKASANRSPVRIAQRGTMGQYWGRHSDSSDYAPEYAAYYNVSIWAADDHSAGQGGLLGKSTYLPIRCLAQE